MMSDDSHEELPWWKERLSDWEDAGYDTTEMEKSLVAKPELASVRLIEFERKVIEAGELIVRMQNPMPGEEMRYDEWNGRLVNPLSVDNVREEIDSWSRTHRPWEVAAWKNSNSWDDVGLRKELVEIIERLDNLDKSSIPQAEFFLDMFDSPSRYEELGARISELENAEEKRRETIARAIDSLEDEGIIIGKMGALDTLEQLKMIDGLHELVNKQRKVRILIENEIFPFDQELAESIDEKRRHMLTLEHRGELDELEERIVSISENLQLRLDMINEKVDSWRKEGIVLPHSDLVRPEELIEWEVNLGEIEDTVVINREANARLERILRLWPNEEIQNQSELSRLDNTEHLVDLVESLEQRWRETELAANNIIESYENEGFRMEQWRHRVSEEPRTALKWLEAEQDSFDRAKTIIEGLESIDGSMEGGKEISERISVLREIELDDTMLQEMEDFLSIKSKRGARHRMMLEREWMALCEQGRASKSEPTSSWSLARFEDEVSAARTGTRVESSIDRLSRRMKQEILDWKKDGWQIDDLLEMVESDGLGVGRMMPIMRKEMARHDKLLERLGNLPWENDVDLAAQVNFDLSRPEKLNSLWNDVPGIAKQLAESGPPDTNFKWDPWKPGPPNRQVLVPIPETTEVPTLLPDYEPADPHEEMLEATLEEMAKEDEEEDSGVEEIEEIPDVKETSKIEKPLEIDETPEIEEADVAEEVPEIVGIPDVEESNDSAPVELSLESLESLLSILGMKQDAFGLEHGELMSNIRRQLAGNVGVEPRDTRVDRLLRLTIRCLPQQDLEDIERMRLVNLLENTAHRLSKWTRNRLIARHSTPRGGLLLDSELLGAALERIPGPGHHLPLTSDDYPLPEVDDLEGLRKEITNLAKYSSIPVSGGIKAA